MAKIQLAVKIKVDFDDEGKIIKSFDITYKELHRKQQRILGKENKGILDVFNKNERANKKIKIYEAEVEALQELGESAKVLEVAGKLKKLYDLNEAAEEKFEKLGGVDKLLEASKTTFDIAVGGKDKKAFSEFIEENSDFATALEAIKKDADEIKKGN